MISTAGEILPIETSEFILEYLKAEGTHSKVSLRKSIVQARDITKTAPGMSTVVTAINRHHPITDLTKPVVDELIKMAEVKAMAKAS